MSRYLYLLRHAQSADKQTGQTDKERALTPVGWEEAKAVGFFFKEKSLIPELIITSPALRAKTTSLVVAEAIRYGAENIVIKEELYEATVTTFFQVLSQVNSRINKVLMVGHNPVISSFADHISDQQNSFRAAEVLALKSDAASWKDIQRGNTEMAGRFHPIV